MHALHRMPQTIFGCIFTRLTFPSRTTFSLQKISPFENRNIFIIAYYQNVMISIQNILAGEFKSSQWTNHVAVISRCQFRSEICFGRNQDILFFEATRLLTYGRKSSSTERVNILTSVFLPNCRHFWIQLVC